MGQKSVQLRIAVLRIFITNYSLIYYNTNSRLSKALARSPARGEQKFDVIGIFSHIQYSSITVCPLIADAQKVAEVSVIMTIDCS